MLEDYLREQRREKDILLMTHIVIGYPSLKASFEIVQAMVEAGVDLMELQIPFSEPIADGPVILKANQAARGDNRAGVHRFRRPGGPAVRDSLSLHDLL
jgi:tryptophan synthase alpha chain